MSKYQFTSQAQPHFLQQPSLGYAAPLSESRADTIYADAISRMYGLVAAGIAVTGIAIWFGDRINAHEIIFSSLIVFLISAVVTVGTLIAASFVASKGNIQLGTFLYLTSTGMMGLLLSYIVDAYGTEMISTAFLLTAGLFVAMCLIGMSTKKDMSALGPMLIYGIVGVIIVSLINIFLIRSSGLDLLISVVLVPLFLALTVYETKQAKQWIEHAAEQGKEDVATSVAVSASIGLYLNFLNVFLRILRILSKLRD